MKLNPLISWQVARRNWLVYKKDFVANVSPSVADPALILVSLGVGLGAFVTDLSGRSYLEFLAPGLVIATALFTSFFESSYGFYIRMAFENIFKAMLTTRVSVVDIVLGEYIWVGLKGALMGLGVGIVLALVGLMKDPWLLPLVPIVGLLVAVPCGALGLIASACVRNINQFQTVYSFLIAPLFYLSGIFYPIDQMNSMLVRIAEIFPVIHGVQLAQALFWNESVVEAFVSHGAILIVQSILLGWISYKLVRKKLIL